MTAEAFRRAFIAWEMTIKDKFTYPNPSKSFEDLARSYGKNITNATDLEIVSQCFDWDVLCRGLEELV